MLLRVLSVLLLWNPTLWSGIETRSLLQELDIQSQNYIAGDEELRKLQAKIFKILKEAEKLEDERLQIEEKMVLLRRSAQQGLSGLKLQEERIRQQRRQLHKQIRELAQWYKLGIGDLLFSSKSVMDLDRRVYFSKRLLSIQSTKLRQYIADQEDFQLQKKDLRVQLNELSKLRKEIQLQESQKKKLRDYHKSLMAQTTKRQRRLLRNIDRVTEQLSLRDEWKHKYFFSRKGHLRLPLQAPLRADFGLYGAQHPRIHLQRTGLEFRTAHSQVVQAVAEGKVVFIGSIPAYGLSLILDHGDRYYTLYGGLQSTSLRERAEVNEGAVLGKIAPRTSLYFEIRKFSQALDPKEWFRDSELVIAKTQDADSREQL